MQEDISHQSEQTSGGQLGDLAIEATGITIANFAGIHLKAAIIFRDRIITLEKENDVYEPARFFQEIQAYASACIISSAAAFEALINELYMAPGNSLIKSFEDLDILINESNLNSNNTLKIGFDEYKKDYWDKFEKLSSLEKYNKALMSLGKACIDKETACYQNAQNLIYLRNHLIHFQPDYSMHPNYKNQSKHHKKKKDWRSELTNFLDGKFKESPFSSSSDDFITRRCMSFGCAEWAIQSVLSFVEEFQKRVDIDKKKIDGFLAFGKKS